MDCPARSLIRWLCLPTLMLAFCLPVRAETGPEPASMLIATASTTKSKPAAKSRHKRPTHYSKATLSAFQPDPAQLRPKADTVPTPAPSAATLLSPVVQKRPDEVSVKADALPVPTEPETPLAKLMEPNEAPKSSDKSRPLPSQEEGLALTRATAVPTADEDGQGVSEEAQAKVEKGVDTGPMNLRVKKQAVQMSVEIPFP